MNGAGDPRSLVLELGSADAQTRNLALARLVRMGEAAVEVLSDAVTRGDVSVRRLAAQGLAEIASPRSADLFARLLRDEDPEVRGRAAQGLDALADPRALDALVATLDDLPDVLHSPYSLSAYRLIRHGESALPAMARLLEAADPMTRARAFLVLRQIVTALPDAGPWDSLWFELGAYDPYGQVASRLDAARRWQAWIGTRAGRR
jgi:hypothetical protein